MGNDKTKNPAADLKCFDKLTKIMVIQRSRLASSRMQRRERAKLGTSV